MTALTPDDQELVAEAVGATQMCAVCDAGIPGSCTCSADPRHLIARLADALSAAAVRYRAEGWDEGYEAAARFHEGSRKGHWEDDQPRKGLRQWIADPAPANPYRALLDENNETQEN